MSVLPERPDLDQLKRQAKELLRLCRAGDGGALDRLRRGLPAARGRGDAQVAASGCRLHDAQSCIAREHGFASWAALKAFVEAARPRGLQPGALAEAFARFAYAGDIAGGTGNARPELAVRLLQDQPRLPLDFPIIACAAGDVAAVRRAILADAGWVHRPAGPLSLPPLVAATHSGLLQLPAFRPRIHAVVGLLLSAGADPDQQVGSRWPPASVREPDAGMPLSALYGAVGRNHDADLARLLLEAGADPNDGESLYHSLEGPGCTDLLLAAGAVVTGTNALFRCLDFDDIARLRLLLDHAGAAPELRGGTLLFHAIRRRRSPAHVRALLAAGVDPGARTGDGTDAAALALRYGLPEVASLLGRPDALSPEERFIAACTSADAAKARRMLSQDPGLVARLDPARLRLLPDLAAEGAGDAVRLMVELGWPIEARGGDWGASALNHAVFRGDSALAEFLLQHGASWRAGQGFGDDVSGTLGWASLNRPVPEGDWIGCARVLARHGMAPFGRDPATPDALLLEGRRRYFSPEVADCLLNEAAGDQGP